jgi:hypothetical protein
MNSASPHISVVVVIVSDTTDGRCDLTHLGECLQALESQSGAPAMEIIVPYPAAIGGLEEIQNRFPAVVLLPCEGLKTYTGCGGTREHHDELRARGITVARGEIVALLEDHARPAPGWAAAMAESHRQPFAGVGGSIDNGINRALNWAVYFCDFSRYQNPLPDGESAFASDANVSYKRDALSAVRSTWSESFHEPAVNWALRSRGERLALCSRAVVYQHRSVRFLGALKERFIWGRSFAAARGRTAGKGKRFVYAALSPVLPFVLLFRMTSLAVKRRRRLWPFVRSLPLTAVLAVSWSIGEFVGYVTGSPGKRSRPEGTVERVVSISQPEAAHADRG